MGLEFVRGSLKFVFGTFCHIEKIIVDDLCKIIDLCFLKAICRVRKVDHVFLEKGEGLTR